MHYSNPVMQWTRVEPGHYTAQDGTTIRREQTTFPVGRRRGGSPVEYRWRLYLPGVVRHVSQRATLAEAKADAERRIARSTR